MVGRCRIGYTRSMMKVTIPLLLAGAGYLFAPATKADCVAGQQVACACPVGQSAVQVCADDGKRFGPCACEATTSEKSASPAELERKSPALFATGIGLLVFGGLSIPGGVGIFVVGRNSSSSSSRGTWAIVGGTFIGLGVASAIAGTILTILGGQRVAKTTAAWIPALRLDAPGATVGSTAVWAF